MVYQNDEFEFKFELPVYRLNPTNHSYNSDLAKMIRKGHPFEETFYIIGKGIDNKEIVKIINKKGNVIYWLMEYEILGGSNTNGNKCHVKTTPVKQVEIEKEHPDKKGYVILKGNYKKL